ncbi:DUF2505 family protein [Plesiomonas shigelloides subsp. oncorhynchi]|nr:DUF2505 family protein [Plesiomonas shigelloides]
MKLNETHVYACSPEQLLPYFTDPERVVAKYQGLKADKVRVMDHEVDGDSVTIATSRDMKNNAPAMLRSVLGTAIAYSNMNNGNCRKTTTSAASK